MTRPQLEPRALQGIRDALRRHPEVTSASVFGSRAKGTAAEQSDVDTALWGDVDELDAQSIAAELDELPLPYLFDVKAFDHIGLESLRAHIQRVGVEIYRAAA